MQRPVTSLALAIAIFEYLTFCTFLKAGLRALWLETMGAAIDGRPWGEAVTTNSSWFEFDPTWKGVPAQQLGEESTQALLGLALAFLKPFAIKAVSKTNLFT